MDNSSQEHAPPGPAVEVVETGVREEWGEEEREERVFGAEEEEWRELGEDEEARAVGVCLERCLGC